MLTYFTFHFSSEKIDWSWIKQSAASQTRFFWRTNVYWRKAYVPDSVTKKLLMERSGFSLLYSTLDYMHLFFNLYVLKKYNQYFFQLIVESKFSSFKYSISLILKISLSYSDQAQQPLKRKKTCSVIDGFKVLILKLQWKEHECRKSYLRKHNFALSFQ